MNLFWKIFLSFWLALVLIVAGSVFVTAQIAERRAESLREVYPERLIAAGVDALRDGGVEELRALLRRVQDNYPDHSLFVIDPGGHDILGRKLPRNVARHWHRVRQLKQRRPGRLRERRPLRLAPRIVGPGGQEFVLLIEPRVRLFGALGLASVPLTVGLFALTVSTLVCWLLARYLAGPVRRLQTTSRRLAQGVLDARVGIGTRRDELADLARDFDSMAERLQTLIESRQRLLRDISHELRSPLARLRLALGLAQRAPADSERQLARIEHEAERLDEMIGRVLALNRLDDPQHELDRRDLSLADLLTGVVEEARIEADESGCQIRLDAPTDCLIYGDPFLVCSAIDNVLRNAIRNTATGTTVDVTLECADNFALIEVRDHGPGVPEAELDRIFEPFYRVSSSRTRDTGGEGIGLAISARVARAHGGNVVAENAHDGGLIVRFRLAMTR